MCGLSRLAEHALVRGLRRFFCPAPAALSALRFVHARRRTVPRLSPKPGAVGRGAGRRELWLPLGAGGTGLQVPRKPGLGPQLGIAHAQRALG